MIRRFAPFSASALLGTGLLFAAGCGGNDGRSTLVETRDEPAGSRCKYGGLRVDRGFDDSGDGLLQSDEILGTSYLCSQRVDGRATVSRIVSLEAGPTCAAGGYRLEVGVDDDDDGVLDDTEVDQGADLCEGVDGTDGYTTRVRLVAIAAGIGGSACPLGGTRVESGADTDRDGVLDDSEVESFQSICSVQVASSLFLVESAIELPGANCAQGGTKMTFGFDENGNGDIDPSEIRGEPVYTCNQIQLVAGKTSLTTRVEATPAECTYGGYVYRTGLDDDYDGVLDAVEVDDTSVICHGGNGFDALVEQTALASTACNGAGGYRVRSGLDVDADGVLDANEVTADNQLCNGAAVYGLDGRDSLIEQGFIPTTPYCDGLSANYLSHGLDLDADLFLDPNEVEYTTYICEGLPGANALVVMEADETGYCYPSYGYIVYTGTDWNANNQLDDGEYTYSYLCY